MKYYTFDDVYAAYPQARTLPYCLKVLLENLLRNKDGVNVTDAQIKALATWNESEQSSDEIQFTPARVIMQDFTGVPCVVDLATMREAMINLGGDPEKINPLKTAQMVIDHSVQIDKAGSADALNYNMDLEFERNAERYQFLKWGSGTFDNFTVVPPGVGIIHQVNIEKLADVVRSDGDLAYFDTCVGTDSHTTMVNGLGVLGWGVGGIEAEAAMLGQSVSMLIPQVVGFKITGKPANNVMATDIVLTITQELRKLGVVGKFVEFFGEGVTNMPVTIRATISNMCPEFGATAAIFGIDEQTIEYLELTGRNVEHIDLVEDYAKRMGVFGDTGENTRYTTVLELDLADVEPSIAGPKRPQDRITLKDSKQQFDEDLQGVSHGENTEGLKNGDVIIASITSCTNTSNPEVLIGAGLLAKKAVEAGLKVPEFVKTSLAPGSRVVTSYLESAGLNTYLDELGFNLVGYGCATCIGNSGPNAPEISQTVAENDLAVCAVLSGNRNFEGRINPDIKLNYLASPPLVVAYALVGTMDFDFANEAIGQDTNGKDVFLSDIWPTHTEIDAIMRKTINSEMYTKVYADVLGGDERWKALDADTDGTNTFKWDENSTYIRSAPYFDGLTSDLQPITDITNARVLALLGDSVTTDHISPAGAIKVDSPAGKYLQEHGVLTKDFNSYGSRRGNHEVMVRGTFANIRLNNLLIPAMIKETKPGGNSYNFIKQAVDTIFDAAQDYASQNTPLIVLAGKEYGTGSSRDWAAKGTSLLGVKVVIAQSFERIHRSNLIGMGVLPLEFPAGKSAQSLGLIGDETYDITDIEALNDGVTPKTVSITATCTNGEVIQFDATVRIDTPTEADYFRNGGILQYVLRGLAR